MDGCLSRSRFKGAVLGVCYDVRDGGPSQWSLDEIDSGRRDGVFAGDLTHVPPGQAICSNLLNDCYRLVYLLYRQVPSRVPALHFEAPR